MDWFVRNLRDMTWWKRGPGGWMTELVDDDQSVGVNLFVLEPGDKMAMYHWEADQEDFLILAGEALLLVEGQERPLRQWDFVHCPPETRHLIVGAGEQGCTLVAVGAREHQTGDWGAYVPDELAERHGAAVEEETSDTALAYARFEKAHPTRYRDGFLPGERS